MSSIREHGRQYDLVVFGATGYTGKLTAEYITTHLSTNLKWAVAGRSESKLQAVVDECRKLNPDRPVPAIEIVNLKDEDLYTIARKTRVLVTTVGPYSLYGEHAFKACAELGTHYVDATGESPWVHSMIKKYEATARKSGAILFPQSGVESAPADLCTWALARTLREELAVPTRDVKISLHKFSSAPSGGTLATALAFFDVYSMKEIRAAMKPFAQSPIPHSEPTRPRESLLRKVLGICSIPNLGILTTSAMASTDAAAVERTWGLLSVTPSREDQFYGPNFTFSEYLKARNYLHGVLFHLVLSIGAVLIALVPPVRTLVRKFVYQPGEGADREQTDKDEIELRGVADPDSDKFAGKQAYCRARFNGGIYFLTGIFLAEVAATILEEDVKLGGGVYTPACLGQPLLDRLDKGGFHLETKIIEN